MVDLGLSEHTWEDYTLRDICGLVDRLERKRAREVDFPTARILHAMYNLATRSDASDPVIPLEQFLLHQPFDEPSEEELKKIGLDFMRGLVARLGGTDNYPK